ncbi:MAG TPA: hypothetical protein VIC85_03640 [Ktedonobacterales bacterium]
MPTSDGPQERIDMGAEDARQRRIEALRDLADGPSTSPGAVTSSAHRDRTARRPPIPRGALGWRVLVPALLIILAVAGATLRFTLFAAHGPANGASRLVPIIPGLDHLDCPRDVAWSPDQSRIAVLGYTGDCPSLQGPVGARQGPSPVLHGVLDIYNTRSGRLVRQVLPDAAITAAVRVPASVLAYLQAHPAPGGTTPFDINYTHVLWSRDGRRFVVTFNLYLPTAPPVTPANQPPYWPGTEVDGVLTMGADGGAPQAYVLGAGAPATASIVEWDLDTGVPVTIPPALSAPSASGPAALTTLPPALGYRWGAHGQLVPQSPLGGPSPSAPPLAPIGDPNGGDSFTIWQPGVASDQIPAADPGQGPLDGVLTWSTDISALSPDGRYVVEHLDLAGLVAAPSSSIPSNGALVSHGWGGAPVLPLRDAGFGQAAGLLAQDAITSPFLYAVAPIGPRGALSDGVPIPLRGVLVAWRPDGRVVAVDAATPDHAVKLYDCASGRLLATLVPLTQSLDHTGAREDGEANVLRWSPDGSRLALFDTTLQSVTVWTTSQLPR